MIKNTLLLTLLTFAFILFGCEGNEATTQESNSLTSNQAMSYQAGDTFTAQKGDTLSATTDDTQVNIKTNIKTNHSTVTVLNGAVELTK